jgi:hypothetical protein
MVEIGVKLSNAILNSEKSPKGGTENPSKLNLRGKKCRFASDMLPPSEKFEIK